MIVLPPWDCIQVFSASFSEGHFIIRVVPGTLCVPVADIRDAESRCAAEWVAYNTIQRYINGTIREEQERSSNGNAQGTYRKTKLGKRKSKR